MNEEEQNNQEDVKDNLYSAFGKDFKQNTGFLNILNQIRILWLKRFWIFFRRYILAALLLLLPLIAEIFICAVIPAQSNQDTAVTSAAVTIGNNDLRISNYGSFNLPYFKTDPTGSLTTYINSVYTSTSRPNVNLNLITNADINNYVLSLRGSGLYKNLLKDYYAGMNLNYTGSVLYANAYFSSLAFHSSASIINEINTLNLMTLAGDSTKSIRTYNIPYKQNSTTSNSFLDSLACIDTLPLSLLNFMNSIIVAFIISVMVMHVARERCNGSKQLQMLSGLHYATYWLSNYVFDFLTCLFNIVTMVVAMKIVDSSRKDPTIETYPIASDGGALGSFFFMMVFNSFSWCTFAYIWSFYFKSDIIVFIVLFVLLGLAAYLDMVWTLVQILVQTSDVANIENSPVNRLMNGYVFLLLMN